MMLDLIHVLIFSMLSSVVMTELAKNALVIRIAAQFTDCLPLLQIQKQVSELKCLFLTADGVDAKVHRFTHSNFCTVATQ